MKILYFFKKYDTYMYNWQIEHFVDELKHHNCIIDILNPLEYSGVEEANEILLKRLRDEKYDLFFTCHNEFVVYKDTICEIKKMGIPTMLFCPDSLLSPFGHQNVAGLFDLVWITSKETEKFYIKAGANTVFLPYAANPYMFKPVVPTSEIPRVAFWGNTHGSRAYRINQLTESQVPVSVHINKSKNNVSKSSSSVGEQSLSKYLKTGFDYLQYPEGRRMILGVFKEHIVKSELQENDYLEINEPIPFDKMAEANGKYALMLSFTEAKSTGCLKKYVPIVNLRHFEIPMAGGLQFAMNSPELSEYFEDGKEIVLCNSLEEYIEKAKYYLRDDNSQKRIEMKLAARKRAEAEHTWYNRFTKIFDVLGLRI